MKNLMIIICMAFLVSVAINAEETATFYYPDGITNEILEHEIAVVVNSEPVYVIRLDLISGKWSIEFEGIRNDVGYWFNATESIEYKIDLYTFNGIYQMSLMDNFIVLNTGDAVRVIDHIEGWYE